MFDYQKLEVYQKSRNLNCLIFEYLNSNQNLLQTLRNQLTRATLSVSLNIAEGSSRFSRPDKRHFYVMARSSAMECVACLDALVDMGELHPEQYQLFSNQYESITRMLFRMIQNLEPVSKGGATESEIKRRKSL